MAELDSFELDLVTAELLDVRGRILSLVGPVIRALLPEATVGQVCEIRNRGRRETIRAEVVGFDRGQVMLMPLGDVRHVGTASEVHPLDEILSVPVGPGLLGRVVDGLGRPLDGRPVQAATEYPLEPAIGNPLSRPVINNPLPVGIRAIDGPLTIGEGMRMGIFAAAGVGKSTLLGMIARNTDADVNVVALIGERNREVREFIDQNLREALDRTVVVVATSDQPALIRVKAAYTATSIAEYFRDQGQRVLLMMDSLTRFTRARRDVGLASGEPVTRGGFTPSCFSELPKLVERAGLFERGSITGIYAVLVEGDDLNEPVADEARSLLDGHIVLSSNLADSGHRPAIDILASLSRVFRQVVVSESHRRGVSRLRRILATYREHEDKVLLGLYQPGMNAALDEAVDMRETVLSFLRQSADEGISMAETAEFLSQLGESESVS